MRRKDRQMDEAFALSVIDQAPYGVLSLSFEGEVLSLPLSFARKNHSLFFHSARNGSKVEAFRKSQQVSLVFVSRAEVPELYSKEELEELMEKEEATARLLSTVFTTEFSSAVAKGMLIEITDTQEKVEALRLLCEKYTPGKMDYFDKASLEGEPLTRIYRIDLTEISGKRKRFSRDGVELKFMASEEE